MNKIARVSLLALSASVLWGCQTTDVTSGPEPIAGAEYVAVPGLTPRERFSLSIEQLDKGLWDNALVELQMVELDAGANSRLGRRARKLRDQATSDPSTYFAEFGGESYSVTVGRNDSLSKIAGRELGDIDLFVALARFNDITVPAALPRGEVLRIPGQPKPAPLSAPAEADILPAELPEEPPIPELNVNDRVTELQSLPRSTARDRQLMDLYAEQLADARAAGDEAAMVAAAEGIAAVYRASLDKPSDEARFEDLKSLLSYQSPDLDAPQMASVISELRSSLRGFADELLSTAANSAADGDWDAARDLAEQVLIIDPSSSRANLLLGGAR